MFKYLLISVLLAFSGLVDADCVSSGSCVDVQVTQLRADVSGNTYVGTSGVESNLQCNPGDKGSANEQLLLKSAGTNYNAVFSLLLSSYVTNSNVTIRTSNASGEVCEILYATATK